MLNYILQSVGCGDEELTQMLTQNQQLFLCNLPACSSKREVMLISMQQALTFALALAAQKVDTSISESESRSKGRSYGESQDRSRSVSESEGTACAVSYSDSASRTQDDSFSESRSQDESSSQSAGNGFEFGYARDSSQNFGYGSSFSISSDRASANGESFTANLSDTNRVGWTTQDPCEETRDNCPGQFFNDQVDTIDIFLDVFGFPALPSGLLDFLPFLGELWTFVTDTFLGLSANGIDGLEHSAINTIYQEMLNDPAIGYYDQICSTDIWNDPDADLPPLCPSVPEPTLCNGDEEYTLVRDKSLTITIFSTNFKVDTEQRWQQTHVKSNFCDETVNVSHNGSVGSSGNAGESRDQSESVATSESMGESYSNSLSNADNSSESQSGSANTSNSASFGYADSIANNESQATDVSQDYSWSRGEGYAWAQNESTSRASANSKRWSNIMSNLTRLWESIESELMMLQSNKSSNRGKPRVSKLDCRQFVMPRTNHHRPLIQCGKLALCGA